MLDIDYFGSKICLEGEYKRSFMKNRNIEEKYSIANKTLILSVAILVFGLLLYLACLIIECEIEAIGNEKYFYLIKIFKDILLIVVSVFGTSVISTFLIDVKSKNQMHKEIISDEVLNAETYYNCMSDSKKKEISNYLESMLYFNGNKILTSMDEELKNKIRLFKNQEYFFSSYTAIINCTIDGDKIIKKINKTMFVRSYDDNYNLKDFELARNVCDSENGKYGIDESTLSVSIEDITLDKNSYCRRDDEKEDSIEKKSGYTNKVVYRLKEPLELYSTKDKKVVVEYDTSVSIKDVFSGIRLPVACKNTNFQFHLNSTNNEHERYKLVPCGFGFNNTGSDTPNNIGDHYNVNIQFNEWIFPNDGWIVVIQES